MIATRLSERLSLSFFAVSTVVLVASGVGWARRSREQADTAREMRRLDPMRRADPATPCGAVSAAVVSRLLGKSVLLKDATHAVPADPLGQTSMAELIAGLRRLGWAAEGLNLSASTLGHLSSPAILHVNGSHFVAAMADGSDHVVLIDPPAEPRAVSVDSLNDVWTGDCVVVARTADELSRCMESVGLN